MLRRYDFAIAPIHEVPRLCQTIEQAGWEVVGAFYTGMAGEMKGVVLPGHGPQVVPAIGVLARSDGKCVFRTLAESLKLCAIPAPTNS